MWIGEVNICQVSSVFEGGKSIYFHLTIGNVFKEHKRKETNPYPDEVMRSRMEVMSNGPIYDITGGQKALFSFTPVLLSLTISVVTLTGNIFNLGRYL